MMTDLNHSKLPVFQYIKNSILQSIHSGIWKEGEAIPSEEFLAKQFGVSRMTVNRALRELTVEKTLIRIKGSGTYVAQKKYHTTPVEIKSIAKQINERGFKHSSELIHLSKARATETLAKHFAMKTGAALFHSVIVHSQNDVPIQVEERWVNAAVAPEYMQQNFNLITPAEYLMAAAPLQGGEYEIEAMIAPNYIAEMLHMKPHQPCLVLRRKTFSMDQVATTSTMWHPGDRYQFSGHF